MPSKNIYTLIGLNIIVQDPKLNLLGEDIFNEFVIFL